MSAAAYTGGDVNEAADILRRSHLTNLSGPASGLLARAVLAAVAPAIAARALRDAILDTRGERAWLLKRADEIEAGQ